MSPSMLKWFRLTKPGVVLLLQITAISAVVVHDLMTEVRPSFAHTLEASLITLVGGYLTAGGSNAINMWYDRDIDPKMKRTSKRPVPAGDIDANHALLFGVTISSWVSSGSITRLVRSLPSGLPSVFSSMSLSTRYGSKEGRCRIL